MKKSSNYFSGSEIKDPKLKQTMLNCISDVYLRSVLFSTIDKPKSVFQISKNTKIPLRTVYRKIGFLIENNLLTTSSVVTDDGKKYFLYQSKIDSVSSQVCGVNLIRVFMNGKI